MDQVDGAQSLTNSTQEAMRNLMLPQYAGIRDVFGPALTARSKQQCQDCTLFTWLSLKAHPLEGLNEDCSIFVGAISLEDAQRKSRPVRDNAHRPAKEFN